jgi:hypothetical protein
VSPRPRRVPPREGLVDWPETASDDAVVESVRRFAVNLKDAIGDRSLREVARISGVDRTTIAVVLAGDAWPDVATLARLEVALERPLWPVFGQE